MTERDAHPFRRPGPRSGLIQLGWPQFWLFAGILGGLLSMTVAIVFASLLFT